MALPLVCLLGPACNGGGGGGGGMGGNFVDPSGEYSVSINQTMDTCTGTTGPSDWGGTTVSRQGSLVILDLPPAPQSADCIRVSAPYDMNTAQTSASQNVVEGSCVIEEGIVIALVFSESGFTGSYTVTRTRSSGDCSMSNVPCTAVGTVTGTPGRGSPHCPP